MTDKTDITYQVAFRMDQPIGARDTLELKEQLEQAISEARDAGVLYGYYAVVQHVEVTLIKETPDAGQ